MAVGFLYVIFITIRVSYFSNIIKVKTGYLELLNIPKVYRLLKGHFSHPGKIKKILKQPEGITLGLKLCSASSKQNLEGCRAADVVYCQTIIFVTLAYCSFQTSTKLQRTSFKLEPFSINKISTTVIIL